MAVFRLSASLWICSAGQAGRKNFAAGFSRRFVSDVLERAGGASNFYPVEEKSLIPGEKAQEHLAGAEARLVRLIRLG
jgi:hypothetical protein